MNIRSAIPWKSSLARIPLEIDSKTPSAILIGNIWISKKNAINYQRNGLRISQTNYRKYSQGIFRMNCRRNFIHYCLWNFLIKNWKNFLWNFRENCLEIFEENLKGFSVFLLVKIRLAALLGISGVAFRIFFVFFFLDNCYREFWFPIPWATFLKIAVSLWILFKILLQIRSAISVESFWISWEIDKYKTKLTLNGYSETIVEAIP